MGIHGEPGLYHVDAPSADGLAELLVEKILAETPSTIPDLAGARIGVILNGLGAVKYEELFVIYRRIDQLLSARGLVIVEPIVDELITSFDMAGLSLTLFWLNDELEQTWLAPADTAAFHRGSIAAIAQSDINTIEIIQPEINYQIKPGSTGSQAAAKVVLAALEAARDAIAVQQDELGRLDAVAGDGDHGIGMHRGITAAVNAAKAAFDVQAGAGNLLTVAGDVWSNHAGGTSGALWGVILWNLGNTLGNEMKPDAAAVAAGIAAALKAVTDLGKAQPGDKTLVDVLHPFSEMLTAGVANNLSIVELWTGAADIANKAAQATKNQLPRIGRARPHADKSIGTPDPGAVSMALIICAVDKILQQYCQ